MQRKKKKTSSQDKNTSTSKSTSTDSDYVTETENVPQAERNDKEEEMEDKRNSSDEEESEQEEKGKTKESSSSSESDESYETEDEDGKGKERNTQDGSYIGSTIGSTIGRGWNLESNLVPVTITFKNLFYSVFQRKGLKQIKKCKNPFEKQRLYILKDLHGSFQPGQVTAIMGPSGAGKTTLLNLIAGRLPSGSTEGQILVNGLRRKKIPTNKWQRLTAYVMQDDVLLSHLTPKETLHFAACLRIPGMVRKTEKRKDKVNSILEELGLQGCKNTRVGSPDARGISGGQRKRVSIGVELITDPSVLFMDEPTTGLDSSTSYSLIVTLKKLAMAGRTIVSTIHQPSSDMFFMFDKVIFLSRGHIIYNGPTTEMVSFFSKHNFKCPSYSNPCEYVMNLAKDDSYIATKEEGVERLQTLVTAYRKSRRLLTWDYEQTDAENHDTIMAEAKEKLAEYKKNNKSITLDEANLKPAKRANFFVQYAVLLVRAWFTIWRHPMLTRVRTIQTLFLALVVGLLYLQIGDDQSSLRDRNGSLFFTTICISITPVMLMQAIFPAERQVFIREHSTGSYTTAAYFLAKVSSEAPFNVIFPALFSVIAYFMVGYDIAADKFFIYFACLVAVTNVCGAFGMALVAPFDTPEIGMALMPMLFTPMMLLGGLFLNSGSTPDWLIWAKWLSPLKYGFEILVLNEYDGLTFYCSSGESKNGTCPITTGAEEIHALALDKSEINIWSDFLFLLLLYMLFLSLAFFFLWCTAGRRKSQ